jgi:hypothetical protein
MKIIFTEVSVMGRKSWKENGKRKTRSKKFSQTLNPWNKNADGSIKTRKQIMAEITAQRDAWIKDVPNADLSNRGSETT